MRSVRRWGLCVLKFDYLANENILSDRFRFQFIVQFYQFVWACYYYYYYLHNHHHHHRFEARAQWNSFTHWTKRPNINYTPRMNKPYARESCILLINLMQACVPVLFVCVRERRNPEKFQGTKIWSEIQKCKKKRWHLERMRTPKSKNLLYCWLLTRCSMSLSSVSARIRSVWCSQL